MGPIQYLIHSEYSMLATIIPLHQWFTLLCYDLFAHELVQAGTWEEFMELSGKKWYLEDKGEGIRSWGLPNQNLQKNIFDNWIQFPLQRTMPRLEMHLSILPCVLLMQKLWNLGQCQQRRLGMTKTGSWAWSTYQPFRDSAITHIFMES